MPWPATDNLHALLIGIDGYPGPSPRPLHGCVNDIDDVQALLLDVLGVDEGRIIRVVSPAAGATPSDRVPARPATRSNIVAAFSELADRVRSGDDRVFIYYAGHGASVTLGTDAAATLREALVPVDVVCGRDGKLQNLIIDLELNRMLRSTAARTEQITVCLDACHSAGATRGKPHVLSEQTSRFAELNGVVSPEQFGLTDLPDGDRRHGGIARELASSVEACAIATACLANEFALESLQAGRRNGHFTRTLLNALAATGAHPGDIRWGSIWYRLASELAAAGQHPLLQASFARKVFGGPREDGDTGFAVTRAGDRYQIFAGELAGITCGTVVGVYGGDPLLLPPAIGGAEDLAARLGALTVVETSVSSALAQPTADTDPTRLATATRGRVIAPGQPLLRVAVQPPDAAIEQAIAQAPYGFFRIADASTVPSVILKRCSTGEWALTDDLHGSGEDDDAPALVKSGDPQELVDLLEHYCVYIAPVELARRCQGPSAITLRLSVLDCGGKSLDPHGRFIVDPDFDPERPDLPTVPANSAGVVTVVTGETGFCFKVENAGTSVLHVTLLECGASGRVSILGGGQVVVPGKGYRVFWNQGDAGAPYWAGLPEGKLVGFDRLVAIGTSAPDKPLDFLRSGVSFADVLAGAKERDSVSRCLSEQWGSAQLTIRVTT